MVLRYVAQAEGKLLRFLRREMGLSSTLVSRLKFKQALLVNGRPVHTDYRVSPGDEISVLLDEPEPEYPPEEGELDILYEDEAILVLDKPAGILMHPTFHRVTGTLANRLLAYYQATGQACAVHPVSRLDRDTFGVVLLAKNAHVHALLCQSQKEGRIEKIYEAAVFGSLGTGILDAPVARLSETSLLRCVREDGKRAVTEYETFALGNGMSHVRLHPKTGRTHQLRVHCAYLGCPILGDPQYGTEESQAFSHALGCTTQQLYARSLHFSHPITAEPCVFTSRQTICSIV